MPTPPKPFVVLSNEKKSHRTKAELKMRERGEKALLSGTALKERPEVKRNEKASKEFNRIDNILKNINKNDAIYEGVINRYCVIHAECIELEERREYFYKLINDLKDTFNDVSEGLEQEEKVPLLLEFTKEIAKLTNGMLNIDKLLQAKRKMLLDIEKENVMTIASALRCIPKKEEKSSNPLLEALNGN